VKDYKPKKEKKETKPAKLHECGHIATYFSGQSRTFEKCGTLTSKKVKLKDGRSIYLCATHAKENQ